MKGIILVCMAAMLALTAARPEEATYPTKYDNVNLDEILENPRILAQYCDCLIDTHDKKCTPEGKELKKYMPDALQTDCAKCTDAQRDGTKKVISYVYKHKPECWNSLREKFDKDNVYYNKHEEELKAIV